MRISLCVVLYISLLVIGQDVACCLGQEAEAAEPSSKPTTQQRDSSADLAAIRAGSAAFVAAFNSRDAKAVAALWTENGEYSDESGRNFVGRDAIEAGYAQFFAEGHEVTMRVMVDSLRMLSDGAAIEDGRAVVDPPPAGAPAISKYTAVHVKVDGKWLMASVRDSRIETPSSFRNVADLEWLIGTWIAEEHGATIESVCSWLANKSFVERRYTIAHADGTKTSGVQLIGWNPLDGHVQSWDFSPDGGNALGIWSPREGGWIAEMRGVTGAGAETTSVNTLTTKTDQTRSDLTVQLAVNKQGIIRGNYTDTATDKTQVIQGSVDKQTQRVAFTVGANTNNVVETGLYNLTKDEAPALLHFGKDRTEQWLLVRLQNPEAPTNN